MKQMQMKPGKVRHPALNTGGYLTNHIAHVTRLVPQGGDGSALSATRSGNGLDLLVLRVYEDVEAALVLL